MPASRFPLSPLVPVGEHALEPARLREILRPYVSDARWERILGVASRRTFDVLPVLEGLVDPGNVNAVLRSAEGLGFGAAHLVGLQDDAAALAQAYATRHEVDAEPDVRIAKRASQGAHKWIEVRAWERTAAWARHARAQGYRVAVTALRADARPIAALDFSVPTALVVGAEHDGASEAMLALADEAVLLPLDGFVQSYNVSVAAALALYHARADRAARGVPATLPEAERDLLAAHYLARAVPHAEALVRHALG